MPDLPTPTHGTAFVVAETRAAAHFLRGIAAHVLAIAEVLPLPSSEVQDRLRTSRSEELFAEHPAFDTYTDLQLLAREEIPDLADRLELASDKCDREAGPGGV
jgi:hypothetical protein